MTDTALFKAAMSELGARQADAAALLGKSPATVASYATGRLPIPPDTWRALLAATVEKRERLARRSDHLSGLADASRK